MLSRWEYRPAQLLDDLFLSMAEYKQRLYFSTPRATVYSYTSSSSAPMVGFVALAARFDPRLRSKWDTFAESLGFPGDRHRNRPLDPMLGDLVAIHNLEAKSEPITYEDLGGQGKPRLTKPIAIEAFTRRMEIEELERNYNIPDDLRGSLPAIRAHVTMGTYRVHKSTITRGEVLEALDRGDDLKSILARHPNDNPARIRAWAAHRTRNRNKPRPQPPPPE
jgi:hypothetical protein